MKNKKVIRACLIALVVIAILTLLEIGIRAIVTNVDDFKEKKTEEKIQNEIYNSDESKLERDIFEFISQITEAIYNDDYEYVFDTLDNSYKKCFFDNNIENMKSYIETNIPKTKDIILANIYSRGSIVKAIIGYENDSYYTTRTFSIIRMEEDYRIIFGDYDSISYIGVQTENNILNFETRYKYVSNNLLCYIVDVKNISDEKVNLNINNAQLILSNGTKVKAGKISSLELASNETQTIEIPFSRTDYGIYFMNMDTTINSNQEIIQLNIK